jgi:predicted dehydrogenase/nucleoside-diphosphate-sugar epimerase
MPKQIETTMDQETTRHSASSTKRPTGTLRVALVGCGAAARELHMPVLSGRNDVKVTALVDRDVTRARELAAMYPVDTILGDVKELHTGIVDAAIVCTPPFHHAPCAIELASRGLHVLLEKPLATTYEDGLAAVEAAEKANVVLSVTTFRRLLPATRIARALLANGLMGRVLDFDVEEGEVYQWPAATLGNHRRDLNGGGVLIDTGSHTFDRLMYLLPGAAEVIDYRDNSIGGIESDCVVRPRIRFNDRWIEGRVELSRTRTLRNSFRFRCERGTIELPSGERYRVSVSVDAVGDADAASLSQIFKIGTVEREDEIASGYEPFSVQMDDWLGAIRLGGTPELNGRSILPSLKLIRECYAKAEPLEEPPVSHGTHVPRVSVAASPTRRVLVTGATGFIGGRVAEILRLRDNWDVRALVHSPSHASRLARLPLELMMGNLSSSEDVSRLVEGCDSIVHCAIGTSWGNRKEMFDVTVRGTERLLTAARAHGVRRFVHLSTFAVHDLSKPGTIDESTSFQTTKPDPWGTDYAESKAAAEKAVVEASRAGVSGVVLRLANVYGPFGTQFITRPLQYLGENKLVLVGPAARIPSSTIYVDNVVEAIIAALDGPDDQLRGQVFTISEGDELTWADFYGYFANATGTRLQAIPDDEYQPVQGPHVRSTMDWILTPVTGVRDVVVSPEMWKLVKRVLKTEPIYSAGKRTLDAAPSLGSFVRRSLGVEQPPVYERPKKAAPELFYFDLTRPVVSNARAKQVLGFRPSVTRDEAMAATLRWARYARILP